MDKKQEINCHVESCMFHNSDDCKCTLESITVKPTANCNTQDTDESKCGSYKCQYCE